MLVDDYNFMTGKLYDCQRNSYIVKDISFLRWFLFSFRILGYGAHRNIYGMRTFKMTKSLWKGLT